MKITQIRIYSEVLEQGTDFKEYFRKCGFNGDIINVYTKKNREPINKKDTLSERIRKSKDVDLLITFISNNSEYPVLMVEYSTAVPTDDHKMQRSDVYFWSSVYKIPMMKIYPKSKGMNQAFGGGSKFTDEDEITLAYKHNAVFYPIIWETMKNSNNILRTKKNALSCIYYSDYIFNNLNNILNIFITSIDIKDYFSKIFYIYAKENESTINKKINLNKLIVNSSRFKWSGDNLISKINRFGHAMDPDRGVLYFTNMLLGTNKCITEIQVNRTPNGYSSLFDGLACEKELNSYVNKLILNNYNIFKDKDAIHIFSRALNINTYNLFTKVSNNRYVIKDDKLESFLNICPSITSKCIFYLSKKLILTDKNRKPICEIDWNYKISDKYIQSLCCENYNLTKIKPLCLNDAKEDIITFASVELYKKIGCELLAVSYPGAQGDRCLLVGNGRTVKRTYIDIIAAKKENLKVTVYLEECKDNFNKSQADVIKLNDIVSNKTKELKELVSKTMFINNFNKVKISIGSKTVKQIPNYKVDYIFMFDIDNSSSRFTTINYSVAIIDTTLIKDFSALLNNKKLRGTIALEKLFIIE